jgi:hypothetical protein
MDFSLSFRRRNTWLNCAIKQRKEGARISVPHNAIEQALYKQFPSPVVLNGKVEV